MSGPCWWGPHTKPHHPLSNLILGTEGVFALTPRGHLHLIPNPIPKGLPCLVPTGEIPPLTPLLPFKPHPSLRGPPCRDPKGEIPPQTPSLPLKSHLHHRGPTIPCPHEGTPPKWHPGHRGILCLVPMVASPQQMPSSDGPPHTALSSWWRTLWQWVPSEMSFWGPSWFSHPLLKSPFSPSSALKPQELPVLVLPLGPTLSHLPDTQRSFRCSHSPPGSPAGSHG